MGKRSIDEVGMRVVGTAPAPRYATLTERYVEIVEQIPEDEALVVAFDGLDLSVGDKLIVSDGLTTCELGISQTRRNGLAQGGLELLVWRVK